MQGNTAKTTEEGMRGWRSAKHCALRELYEGGVLCAVHTMLLLRVRFALKHGI